MSDSAVVERVRQLVAPIASDLGLDLYDVERRGGTMRVTLDTPVGSSAGVTLDTLALATRLMSRELDHSDPIPGRYTLEVSSPGVERSLRTPEHFRREVGKTVAVRLHAVTNEDRRLEGELVAADDDTITIRVADDAEPAAVTEVPGRCERVIKLDQIDRARTVFEWKPNDRPATNRRKKSGSKSHKRKEKKSS